MTELPEDPIARFAALRMAGLIPPIPDDATFIGFMDVLLPKYQHIELFPYFKGYSCYIPDANPPPRHSVRFGRWEYGKWRDADKVVAKKPRWALAIRNSDFI